MCFMDIFPEVPDVPQAIPLSHEMVLRLVVFISKLSLIPTQKSHAVSFIRRKHRSLLLMH